MKSILFLEAPIDPFCIVRHLPSAGLAFEKHRWTFYHRLSGAPDTVFEYTERSSTNLGAAKFKKIVKDVGEVTTVSSYSDFVRNRLFPKESMYFTLLHEIDWLPMKGTTGIEDTLIYNFVKKRIGQLYLGFQTRLIHPPGEDPRRVRYIIEKIFGEDSVPVSKPGIVPIVNEQQCKSVLSSLRCRDFTDFYLFSMPHKDSSELDESAKAYRNVFDSDDIEYLGTMAGIKSAISYNGFVKLVSSCEWMLTTHNHVLNETPFCFYSKQDLRPSIRDAAATTEASQPHAIIDIDDVYQLTHACEVLRNKEEGIY